VNFQNAGVHTRLFFVTEGNRVVEEALSLRIDTALNAELGLLRDQLDAVLLHAEVELVRFKVLSVNESLGLH
jgi:hypothetical protein